MKCEECKRKCVPDTCHRAGSVDNNPGPARHPGWTVHYCQNNGCSLGAHHVPQVPGRKAVDSIEFNSNKPRAEVVMA